MFTNIKTKNLVSSRYLLNDRLKKLMLLFSVLFTIAGCPDGQAPCQLVDMCISISGLCNGEYDCPDQSDEYGCPDYSDEDSDFL